MANQRTHIFIHVDSNEKAPKEENGCICSDSCETTRIGRAKRGGQNREGCQRGEMQHQGFEEENINEEEDYRIPNESEENGDVLLIMRN